MPRQAQKVRTKAKATKTTQKEAVKTSATTTTKIVQETSSTQEIHQKQSQELTQTLVYGSISCITYLRSLFPDRCFDEQLYGVSDNYWCYDKYVSGKVPQDDGQPNARTKFKVLRKGRHDNVDKFLEMLEKGAFDALQKKVLRALQLTLTENPDHPEEVIESWTFTFNYTQVEDGEMSLSQISLKTEGGTPITVKNAKYALQTMQRMVVTLCSTLPDLPQRRYMNVLLYYTDDCDKDYEPPGFKPVHDLRQLWPEDKNWTKESRACGLASFGFHSVKLKASYLLPANEMMPEEDGSTNSAIPAGMKKTLSCLGQDDVQLEPSALSANTEVLQKERVVDLDETQSSLSDLMDVDELYASPTPKLTAAGQAMEDTNDKRVADSLESQVPEASTQRSTQGQEVRRMQKGLQKMLEHTPAPQSLEETQLLDAQRLDSQAHYELSERLVQPQLSPRKLKELQWRKRTTSTAPVQRTRSRKQTSKDGNVDIVDCQCGHQDEEDDMINCSFCNRWQHLVCYGYRNSNDPRIPQVHACYKCLLQEQEPDVYRKLEGFTLLRKGAHVLLEEGYNSDKQFAEKLHCTVQDASRVQKRLRKEGFLEPTPGSHSAGFFRTGKPKFMAAKDEEARKRLYKTYFEPTFEIGHHFSLPERQLPETGSTIVTTQFPLPPSESQLTLDPISMAQPRVNNGTSFSFQQGQNAPEVPRAEEGFDSPPRKTYRVRRPQLSPPPSSQQPTQIIGSRKSTSKRSLEQAAGNPSEKRLRSSRGQGSINVGVRSPSPMT